MSGATSPEAETIIRQTTEINRVIGESSRGLERLKQSLDLTYSAQVKFEQAQDKINAGLARGKLSQEEANRYLDLARDRYDRATAAASSFAAVNENIGARSRNFGSAIGQAGFQIQDFAVQVQSGTSALTALSQQGSQMLGVFGVGGAIAGAVLTVGILAAQIMGVSTSTDAAKSSAEGWADQLRTLNDLMETSAQRAARLRSEQIQSGRLFAMQQMQQSQYEAETQGQRALRLEGQISGLERLNRRLLPDQRTQNESELEALRLELMTARSRGDVATAGVRRARELMDQFGEQELRGGGADKPKPTLAGVAGGQRGDVELERVAQEIRAQGEAFRWMRENAQVAFDTIIQQLDPVDAAFARSQERLNALADAFDKAGGAISEGEFQRGVTLIEQKLRQDLDAALGRTTDNLNGLGREFGTVFTSAFDGLISGAKSFNDVLENTEKALMRLVERQLVTKPLESFFNAVFAGKNSDGSALTGVAGLARSGVDWIGAQFAGIFHEGGIVGQPGPGRMVPIAAFFDAPRYHTGGFAGAMPFAADEVPAVLRRGEVVLTERQQEAVRSGGRTINQTVIVKTEDPGAFKRSETQFARDTARALMRASRGR